MRVPLITLTTDFGCREASVAVLKGVLLSRCPGVQVVDLSHEVPREAVLEGALFLAAAVPAFPEGTVHLVDVAPGPTPVVVATRGQLVVCPDNGITTLLVSPGDQAWSISVPGSGGDEGRQVYFGRDVFAPAAAMLASGVPPQELGAAFGPLARLAVPEPKRLSASEVRGQIIHIDRFGNLVTNIHRSAVEPAGVVEVLAGALPVREVVGRYSDVPFGCPLVTFGADGFLQVAYNGDRADARLGLTEGIFVTARLAPPGSR